MSGMHGMSAKRYVVELSAAEREQARAVVDSKQAGSRERRARAQILLKVDQGPLGPAWTDDKAAEAFDVHETMVSGLRRRLVEEGFEPALHRKPQENPSVPRKLDGAAEARLIATLQGPPPEGRSRWSLRLLSDKVVELGITNAPVSHETVRQALKKTR